VAAGASRRAASVDHDTISDVVLHLRYTAREGGAPLRAAATEHLRTRMAAAATAGSVRLLSLRHEFPAQWARFAAVSLGGQVATAQLTFELRAEHYPFWAPRLDPIVLTAVELFVRPGPGTPAAVTVLGADDTEDALLKDAAMGDMRIGALTGELPAPVGEVTWQFNDNTMADILVALTWGQAP
jgi:hypothetical protein